MNSWSKFWFLLFAVIGRVISSAEPLEALGLFGRVGVDSDIDYPDLFILKHFFH
jgi:hypothetical protein